MEKRKKEKRENGEKLESEVKENGSTYQKCKDITINYAIYT